MSISATGYTELYGIIGNPVKHSLSPAMYNLAFRELEIDAVYLAFQVDPSEVGEFISTMKLLNIKGGNVTMPLKAAVIPFLDEISDEARIMNAVNTLVNTNGEIKGYNTDGKGMVMSIKSKGYKVKDQTITILGAGGASNAITVACCLEGAREIHLFKRNQAEVSSLEAVVPQLKEMNPNCNITINSLEEGGLKERILDSQIVINATPVGMAPNENTTPIEDLTFLRKKPLVIDAVYNPRVTRLLAEAESVGCPVLQGIGMLLWQGVESFRLFTNGKSLPVEKIAKSVFSITED